MYIIPILLAIVVGAGGFLVIHFWMLPLLNYIDAKKRVASLIVYYANVLGDGYLSEDAKIRPIGGTSASQRNAANLMSCYYVLPRWYRTYLGFVGENPTDAARGLIGLSTSDESKTSSQFTALAAKALRMQKVVEGIDGTNCI